MASGAYAVVARVAAHHRRGDLLDCLYAIIDHTRLIFRGRTGMDNGMD